MIAFAGRGILLDIEGTTSSIRFVCEVLFPYARRQLADYLRRHWHEPATAQACERIARDAGAGVARDQEWVCAEVSRLMDADAKQTGLKELQGLIWQEGYQAGELRSHVYPDVAPALRHWAARGLDVRIFSSGSVAAQKAFFARTEAGDLLGLFRGHYDTTIGLKREAESYRRIAADMGLDPPQILFLSDVLQELDAAADAGLHTGLVVRPGNAPVPPGHAHPVLTQLDDVSLA